MTSKRQTQKKHMPPRYGDLSAYRALRCRPLRRRVLRPRAFRGALHGCNRIQHGGKFSRQRRAGMKRDAGTGPLERNGLRVQKRALEPLTLQFRIAIAIAVLVVAQQRMSGEGGVDPDLMRAPGWNIHFHEGCERSEKLDGLEHADRVFAGGGDSHVALAVLAIVRRERSVDAFRSQLPAARDQG